MSPTCSIDGDAAREFLQDVRAVCVRQAAKNNAAARRNMTYHWIALVTTLVTWGVVVSVFGGPDAKAKGIRLAATVVGTANLIAQLLLEKLALRTRAESYKASACRYAALSRRVAMAALRRDVEAGLVQDIATALGEIEREASLPPDPTPLRQPRTPDHMVLTVPRRGLMVSESAPSMPAADAPSQV